MTEISGTPYIQHQSPRHQSTRHQSPRHQSTRRFVIPILLYHGVNSNPTDRLAHYTVTPEVFAEHLDMLIEGNFRCLTVTQYVNEVRTGAFGVHPDNRLVALVTFDDGWADFAEFAAPIMAERNIPSTIYITTGFVSGGTTEPIALPEEPMMSWSQIPELVDAGIEIGSHSHSHPHMDTMLPGRAWDELVQSKAMLEDAIGDEVRSFAYPHGYNSAHLRHQTRLAGYDSAAGVRNALSHSDDDMYCISRLTVTDDNTPDDIEAWLYGEGAPVAPRREHIKTRVWRTYRYGKALLTNQVGSDYQ